MSDAPVHRQELTPIHFLERAGEAYADRAAVIDTLENKVIDTIAIGQAPQGVAYVPNAVPEGDGTQNLQPLGVGAAAGRSPGFAPSRILWT